MLNEPNFEELARFSIEIFHPEVLTFPENVIAEAIEFKAQKLRESYLQMLKDR